FSSRTVFRRPGMTAESRRSPRMRRASWRCQSLGWRSRATKSLLERLASGFPPPPPPPPPPRGGGGGGTFPPPPPPGGGAGGGGAGGGGERCLHLVDPPVGAVPVIDGIDVVGPPVVPVGDVDRAVGAGQAVDRAEPGVVGHEELARLPAGEARPLPLQRVPQERVGEEVARDVGTLPLLGVGAPLVDDAATGDVAALEVLARDVVEVAVGVRVV